MAGSSGSSLTGTGSWRKRPVSEFREIAAGMFVLRYPVLDVNVSLLVSDGAALLVDTLSTGAQARELAEAVRRITPTPLTIVNTHHHFDHCFGNAVLAPLAGEPACIWAHEETVRVLRERGGALPREVAAAYAETEPALASAIAEVTVLPPNRGVPVESTLDIGGRVVRLLHFGRGHTAGDLVVHVPDAGVVVAGDLVEEGAAPDFGEAYPIEWPETLAAILPLLAAVPHAVVVPGHGAVVAPDFVQAQHADLTALAGLIREGHRDRVAPEKLVTRSPFGGANGLTAIRRGYAELNAELD
jgi:glyoxylase-like metal-dependent hydrolase (beta-lactamase superfamily II)